MLLYSIRVLTSINLLTMKYTCTHCTYTSNRKYNLERHIALVHETETRAVANDSMSLQNPQANSMDSHSVQPPTMCTKCKRSFSNEFSRKRHETICKGVANPLECHLCHMVFNLASSKCMHLKKCRLRNITTDPQQPSEMDTVSSPSNMNTNTTINNNTTNNITHIHGNQENINNNYIVFNICSSDPIPFEHNQLDNAELLRRIFTNAEFFDALYEFSDKLLTQPQNNIFRKENLARNVSKVLVDSEYRVVPDEQIYYKIARGVSSSALVLTDKHKKKVNLDEQHKKCLQTIQTDCEVGPVGSDDENTNDTKYSKTTKRGIRTVKAVVHDITTRMRENSKTKPEEASCIIASQITT